MTEGLVADVGRDDLGASMTADENAIAQAAYDRTHGTGAWDAAWAETERIARPDSTRLKPYRLDEYLARSFPADDWRVDGLLPLQGFGLVLGAEKAGKSLLAMQMGLCIASGQPFLERTCLPAPVLLIEEEGSEKSHQWRLRRQCDALGISDPGAVPFWTMMRSRVRLDDPPLMRQVEDIIRANSIRVVLIGPLAQVASIEDENRSGDVGRVIDVINRLITDHGLAVVLGHHRRKPSQGSPAKPRKVSDFFNSSRGSSALPAAYDVGIGIARDQEEGEGQLYVSKRDGAAEFGHFVFDSQTLLIHRSEAPEVTPQKAPPDEVRALLQADGQLTVAYVATRYSCSLNTAQTRLDELVKEGVAVVSKEGRKNVYLRVETARGITSRPADPSDHLAGAV